MKKELQVLVGVCSAFGTSFQISTDVENKRRTERVKNGTLGRYMVISLKNKCYLDCDFWAILLPRLYGFSAFVGSRSAG